VNKIQKIGIHPTAQSLAKNVPNPGAQSRRGRACYLATFSHLGDRFFNEAHPQKPAGGAELALFSVTFTLYGRFPGRQRDRAGRSIR